MKGTLKLTQAQLWQMARFLELLTAATKETGVMVTSYSGLAVEVDGDDNTNLEFGWQRETEQYVVEDYPR